jgi:hypothetical protein
MAVTDKPVSDVEAYQALTLERLRKAREDGTFTVDDFPELPPSLLAYMRSLDWGKLVGEERENNLLIWGHDELLKALIGAGYCTSRRVYDDGVVSGFALKPAALVWPTLRRGQPVAPEDVQVLVKYLGFYDVDVRCKAAEELRWIGVAAGEAVPALRRVAEDGTRAAVEARKALKAVQSPMGKLVAALRGRPRPERRGSASNTPEG